MIKEFYIELPNGPTIKIPKEDKDSKQEVFCDLKYKNYSYRDCKTLSCDYEPAITIKALGVDVITNNFPADLSLHNNVDIEIWYRDGKIHRDNGPAIILKSLKYNYYAWFQNNLLHNNKNPSIVIKDTYSQSYYWHNNNKLDRVAGPAFLRFYPFEKQIAVEYYKAGSLHNSFGPSVETIQCIDQITLNNIIDNHHEKTFKTIEKEYWLNGIKLNWFKKLFNKSTNFCDFNVNFIFHGDFRLEDYPFSNLLNPNSCLLGSLDNCFPCIINHCYCCHEDFKLNDIKN